jgi:tRNA threonylcarbamoyladenosine biosynthesis protein TsaE
MTIFNKLRAGFSSSSPETTEAVGRELAGAVQPDRLIALSGDLGTGKTTLIRGIARGLGISGTVNSPTYTIYTIHQGDRQLLHMDAYRLSDASDLETLALEDFLLSPFLIAVEWPERIPGFIDAFPAFHLELTIAGNQEHHIRLVRSPD